jgi:hypothetical protein
VLRRVAHHEQARERYEDDPECEDAQHVASRAAWSFEAVLKSAAAARSDTARIARSSALKPMHLSYSKSRAD